MKLEYIYRESYMSVYVLFNDQNDFRKGDKM